MQATDIDSWVRDGPSSPRAQWTAWGSVWIGPPWHPGPFVEGAGRRQAQVDAVHTVRGFVSLLRASVIRNPSFYEECWHTPRRRHYLHYPDRGKKSALFLGGDVVFSKAVCHTNLNIAGVGNKCFSVSSSDMQRYWEPWSAFSPHTIDMMALRFMFSETSELFSRTAALFYIPTSSVGVIWFLCLFGSLCCCLV